ncbi:MAG TPA: hypothetical protein VKA01_00785 [Vicinamibacteria bacterium]|nr:hypothetical protein [Vicinamibacteria bacterium]
MGRIVIACYKPKPGQEEALGALVAEHSQPFSEFAPFTAAA